MVLHIDVERSTCNYLFLDASASVTFIINCYYSTWVTTHVFKGKVYFMTRIKQIRMGSYSCAAMDHWMQHAMATMLLLLLLLHPTQSS